MIIFYYIYNVNSGRRSDTSAQVKEEQGAEAVGRPQHGPLADINHQARGSCRAFLGGKQFQHPLPPVQGEVRAGVPGNRQEEAHGIRHQVRVELARGLHHSQNYKENLGSLCHYQSPGCHQAHLKKCTLSTSAQTDGRRSVLRSCQN